MDDIQLRALRIKLEKAESIKKAINNLENMLKNLKLANCKKISFEYYGPSKGLYGQLDDIGLGRYCYQEDISSESIGISESEYDQWFTEPLIGHITELKRKLEKDFQEFSI